MYMQNMCTQTECDHVHTDWKLQESGICEWYLVPKVWRVSQGGHMVVKNLEKWVKGLDFILPYEVYFLSSIIFQKLRLQY